MIKEEINETKKQNRKKFNETKSSIFEKTNTIDMRLARLINNNKKEQEPELKR